MEHESESDSWHVWNAPQKHGKETDKFKIKGRTEIMRATVMLRYTWCIQYVSDLFFVLAFKIVVDF